MAKNDQGMRLPGGLILPFTRPKPPIEKLPKLGKKPPEGIMAKSTKLRASGIKEINFVNLAGPRHTHEPDERKARREDNKFMARSRKIHRRRKKHGRQV